MVGFGGAITWYADRVTSSPQQDAITDTLFTDLGIDILRLKNWYFPVGYPENTTPDEMEVNWFKPHFDATDQLYDIAKEHNEDIDVLLSSWTPPSSLKSNGELEEGTLKQEDGAFTYDAFATYWMDVLDHVGFAPRYVSIQNEPDYVTPDWETCEWRPTETSAYPGYATAIEHVHQKLQNRQEAPTLLGPEAANLGSGSFPAFAGAVQDKDYVGMYGYHLYNFNESTSIREAEEDLRQIPQDYGNKPNLMTEFSGLSWMKTARLINSVIVEAGAAGYVYWELMWAPGSDNAILTVDDAGNFEVSPFYHLLKHFAKHIDEGDQRISVSSEDESLSRSAYLNPSGDQVTLVLVNAFDQMEVDLSVAEGSVEGVTAYRSTEGNYYQKVSASADEPLGLPEASITTVVLDLS
jgi:O-glycosyl hydrolase